MIYVLGDLMFVNLRSEVLVLFILLNVCIYPQDQKIKTDSTITYINSVPEGAQVYLNDSPIGTTPLTIPHIPVGGYKIKMQKQGYKDWSQTFYIYNEIFNNLTAILDGNYGVLDVYSEPSGAKVYIDTTFVGNTPLKNLKLECSRYNVKIRREGYEDFNMVYPITPRYFYLFPKLNSVTSVISVCEVAPTINIKVDGKVLDKDSLENRTITTGKHEIEFSGYPLKRIFSEELNVSPDFTYRVELKSKSFNPVYYSVVIPGTGQLHNGSYIKGTTILAGAIVSGIFAISSISNYKEKIDAANYASKAYMNSRTELQALYYHDLVNSTRSDADKALTKERIAIGAFIGIYLFNLLDALLFESNDYVQVYSRKINVTTDIGMQRPASNYQINFRMPLR